jgi:hypothetical protein
VHDELNERFMSISREQALAVFHQRYPRETLYWVEITDTLPANCNVYMRPTNCWFVLFHRFRQIATASFDTTKSANASQ